MGSLDEGGVMGVSSEIGMVGEEGIAEGLEVMGGWSKMGL
jgi:hypothetical protein